MRMALTVTLLCALAVGQRAHAQETNIQHPIWTIIATFIDRTTGERLKEIPLDDPDLQFEDRAECLSVLDKMKPMMDDHLMGVATVLTCRESTSDVQRQRISAHTSVL